MSFLCMALILGCCLDVSVFKYSNLSVLCVSRVMKGLPRFDEQYTTLGAT